MGDSSQRRPSVGGIVYLYRELWRLAHGARGLLAGAIGLLISAQVVLLAVPYLSARAINALQLQGSDGLGSAAFWLSMTLVAAAGSWLLHGPGRILERNVSLRIRRRISSLLIERLMALPLSWHESHHSGATAHRVQQSSHALSSFAQCQFIYLNSAVRLVGPVAALWWLEPYVGMAAVLGFTVIVVSVVGFDRAMIRLAHQENDAERRYAAALIDTLGNATTLFALRQARSAAALLEKRMQAIFAPLKRSILLNEAKWCTVDLASKLLSCALVALFAWLATRGAQAGGTGKPLLLGNVYMVWEYAIQAGGVIAAAASHFQTFARQHADYASADIIRETATAPAAEAASGPIQTRWQRLDLHEITFRHAAGRGAAPALDRVGLSLRRGKRYALIGSSGSGKSTLLRVLAGLYTCERVVLDRDDGPAIVSPPDAARFLRATTTLIPQDAEVFEGSLAENLRLCESVNGPPSPAAYPRALELARVTDFVEPTEQGLEVDVAEHGANWSGGQRSRVALARGILAAEGSSLVLLDEPTAHLDPKTEAHVYANLFAAFEDACVVSSVHRLNLLERFDEVLVMHEGRLVAQGPVDALLLGSPEFQQLLAAHRHQTDASPAREDTSAAVA